MYSTTVKYNHVLYRGTTWVPHVCTSTWIQVISILLFSQSGKIHLKLNIIIFTLTFVSLNPAIRHFDIKPCRVWRQSCQTISTTSRSRSVSQLVSRNKGRYWKARSRDLRRWNWKRVQGETGPKHEASAWWRVRRNLSRDENGHESHDARSRSQRLRTWQRSGTMQQLRR